MLRNGTVETARTSRDEVLRQVDRICQSKELAQCRRLRPLLRYLVQRTVRGGDGEPKEYEIGLDVFGRNPSYDPAEDPIVRVEVGRLRSKLKRYYSAEGQQYPILISLPTGTYMPVLEFRAPPASIQSYV